MARAYSPDLRERVLAACESAAEGIGPAPGIKVNGAKARASSGSAALAPPISASIPAFSLRGRSSASAV